MLLFFRSLLASDTGTWRWGLAFVFTCDLICYGALCNAKVWPADVSVVSLLGMLKGTRCHVEMLSSDPYIFDSWRKLDALLTPKKGMLKKKGIWRHKNTPDQLQCMMPPAKNLESVLQLCSEWQFACLKSRINSSFQYIKKEDKNVVNWPPDIQATLCDYMFVT